VVPNCAAHCPLAHRRGRLFDVAELAANGSPAERLPRRSHSRRAHRLRPDKVLVWYRTVPPTSSPRTAPAPRTQPARPASNAAARRPDLQSIVVVAIRPGKVLVWYRIAPPTSSPRTAPPPRAQPAPARSCIRRRRRDRPDKVLVWYRTAPPTHCPLAHRRGRLFDVGELAANVAELAAHGSRAARTAGAPGPAWRPDRHGKVLVWYRTAPPTVRSPTVRAHRRGRCRRARHEPRTAGASDPSNAAPGAAAKNSKNWPRSVPHQYRIKMVPHQHHTDAAPHRYHFGVVPVWYLRSP
jgi:hypothetical protein